jgi:putative DNA primase/helicase
MGEIAYRSAADIEPKRIGWLWPGWLPAGVFVGLNGKQGDGKGTVMASVIASFTTGSPLPDGYRPTESMNCALLSLEDDTERTLVPRLAAAGADLGRVFILDGVDSVDEDGASFRRPWQMPADLDALRAFIVEHGVALLVLDPIGYMIRTTKGDTYGEVGAVLIALRDVAEATGCTIVAVRHLRKAGANDPRDAGIGSTAWSAVVRVELVVGRDPGDESGASRVLAMSKNNLGPEDVESFAYTIVTDERYEVGRVRWGGVSAVTARGLTADVGDGAMNDRAEARELLVVLLADGPMSATEAIAACKQAGIGERTLRKAKDDLKIRSEKTGLDGGWVWVLPEGCNEAPKALAALQGCSLQQLPGLLSEDSDQDPEGCNPASALESVQPSIVQPSPGGAA